MGNFLVASAIYWVLETFAVSPLTHHFAEREFQTRRGLVGDSPTANAIVGVGSYISADILILGIAGLIAGLMGFRLIAISLRARGWAGLITFILFSFIGYACTHSIGTTA